MQLQDFKIGKIFYGLAGMPWLCTDKGTRTISAIALHDEKDPAWFKGPPYIVDEIVFDEHSMKICYTDESKMLNERMASVDNNPHPGFLSTDVHKMMKESFTDNKRFYPYQKVLKRDRVGIDGSILHPYSAINIDGKWYIKTFDIFTKNYSKMHDEEFIKLNFWNNE